MGNNIENRYRYSLNKNVLQKPMKLIKEDNNLNNVNINGNIEDELKILDGLILGQKELCDRDPSSFAYKLSLQSLIHRRDSVMLEKREKEDEKRKKVQKNEKLYNL